MRKIIILFLGLCTCISCKKQEDISFDSKEWQLKTNNSDVIFCAGNKLVFNQENNTCSPDGISWFYYLSNDSLLLIETSSNTQLYKIDYNLKSLTLKPLYQIQDEHILFTQIEN